jgi:hypothetical protein
MDDRSSGTTTLDIMTLSIKDLFAIFSIKHSVITLNVIMPSVGFFIVMLNVIMLSVIMLSIVMLNVAVA